MEVEGNVSRRTAPDVQGMLERLRRDGARPGPFSATEGTGAGTRESPWRFAGPTGESLAYRDLAADPPALVVEVGKVAYRYHLNHLEDVATLGIIPRAVPIAGRARGRLDGYARSLGKALGLGGAPRTPH